MMSLPVMDSHPAIQQQPSPGQQAGGKHPTRMLSCSIFLADSNLIENQFNFQHFYGLVTLTDTVKDSMPVNDYLRTCMLQISFLLAPLFFYFVNIFIAFK